MPNIAIDYASGRGHTRKLAEEIAATLGAEGCAARLIDVEVMFKKDWDALMEADVILFGAPTYMGSAAAAFKQFMDETGDIWARQEWVDKLAGGFTVATFPGGDKLSTLMQLTVFAAQHGMVWVGQDQIGAPANKETKGSTNPVLCSGWRPHLCATRRRWFRMAIWKQRAALRHASRAPQSGGPEADIRLRTQKRRRNWIGLCKCGALSGWFLRAVASKVISGLS